MRVAVMLVAPTVFIKFSPVANHLQPLFIIQFTLMAMLAAFIRGNDAAFAAQLP